MIETENEAVRLNGRGNSGPVGHGHNPVEKAYAIGGRTMKLPNAHMFNEYPDILNIQDIQLALGIGRSMAYRLIKDGKIKHLRVGKSIKIPKCFLVDYIRDECYNGTVAAGYPLPKKED